MKGNLAMIIKKGKIINIAEDDLQKGELVILQAGDLVPADLKLVEAIGLEIDEFELTGEIMPVVKKADESEGFVYKGSRVIKGKGKGVAVAIGEQTEYDKILKQGWEQKKDHRFRFIERKHFIPVVLLLPALIISLNRYHNHTLVYFLYLILTAVILLLQNKDLFKYLLVLKELRRLENQNIYVRDLNALELFSDVNVMCLDKTGVLTARHIEVKSVYLADGKLNPDSLQPDKRTFALIKTGCALCNDLIYFEKVDQAGPIDRALISFAGENGVDTEKIFRRYKRIYEKPFDSEDRYMASGFELNNREAYFAKGDPDVILKMCMECLTISGSKKRMDLKYLSYIKSNMDSITKKGDIVIALAHSTEAPGKNPLNYTFLCLLQLENPLKPGSRDVVWKMKEHGIRSIMLTGDRPETAVNISKECGIGSSDSYLTGKQIETMALWEVARQSAYVSVFARLLPSQKGVLIRLLQQKGHNVAMVGDGANDTVALKVAEVGISFVKNSSPLAKRAAKILINDLDDLLSIIKGANRLKRRVKYLKLLRVISLAIIFFYLYAWALD